MCMQGPYKLSIFLSTQLSYSHNKDPETIQIKFATMYVSMETNEFKAEVNITHTTLLSSDLVNVIIGLLYSTIFRLEDNTDIGRQKIQWRCRKLQTLLLMSYSSNPNINLMSSKTSTLLT